MAASVSGAAAAPSYAAYGDDLAQLAGPSHGSRTIHVHPVSSYSFGVKPARPEKDASVAAAMLRHRRAYEREGARRIVEAILLVNQHNHPHVLLLQSGGGGPGQSATFKLPGGKLRHGEGEAEGLARKLHNKLSPASERMRKDWECLECVARWHRPGFEPNYYPYLPAHVTRPKETRAVFACQLPDAAMFAVPRNLKLLAVPLFELYANENRYGAIVASVPHHVSRFNLNLEEPKKEPTKPTEEMPARSSGEAGEGDEEGKERPADDGEEKREGEDAGAAAAAAAGE